MTTRHPEVSRQRGIQAVALTALLGMLLADAAHAVEASPFEPEKEPAVRLLQTNRMELNVKRLTVTYGTTVRARGRSPEHLPPGNAARVGVVGTSPGGINIDDGNLNYDKGSEVSNAVKGIVDLELTFDKTLRAFVRAKAWDDRAQRRDAVPHGSFANGYAADTPLSDTGFSQHARFSNAVLMDAYVEKKFDTGAKPLLIRLGSQHIPWGLQETTILGGLEQINAIDYPARFRAGTVLDRTLERDEGYIPVPAVFVRWGEKTDTSVEAFYLFKFQENEFPGCGTFFALTDYSSPGCERVLAQPPAITDPRAIALGLFARRAPDDVASDSGQFGVAFKQRTKVGLFGAHYANYHSRRFSPTAIKSTRPAGAPPLIPGDPDGRNVRYFIEYPEDVRVFGLTWAAAEQPAAGADRTWRPRWGLYAEYTYRPNQTILLGSTDLFNAFASNTEPTQLRADANATPPGGIYPGYDRRRISQFLLSGRTLVDPLLGGTAVLSGETGFKYIHDLPDVNVRRYGRSDVYGLGPVNGVCPAGATPKQCSNDGFATAFSWGYRARASVRYPGAIGDVALIPTMTFQHDVKGFAHDLVFLEARKAAVLSLRAELKQLFVEAGWTAIWGGDYNANKDRDFYSLTAGLKF
jgi:hypothetical protein